MSLYNYKILQELGSGTFGITYLGYDKINKRNVAIKTIDINKSIEKGANIAVINDEIQAFKDLLGCIYIAQYYESFEDIFNDVPTIFIVSEYINGGSLNDLMTMFNKNVIIPSPNILWPLFLQLLLGLNFIHSKGYAHRDIKPDNILITEDYTIKYIDFGTACLSKCRISSCTNICEGINGTLYYMPPEFFTGTQENSLIASQAHDIWSLAIVMYQLANGGTLPFEQWSIKNIKTSASGYKDEDVTFLSIDIIKENIAHSPQFPSEYILDDGRTNIYIQNLLVNDWHKRPTAIGAKDTFIEHILTKVWVNIMS